MSYGHEIFIREVVHLIHENIRELNERKGFAEANELDHIEGKLIAYHEVLALLRTGASESNLSLAEFGL